MKRDLSNIISAMLLLCLTPITSFAEKVEIDGIRYSLDNKTKEATVISKNSKYSGAVVIPSTVKNENIEFSVTCIDGYTFSGCSGLASVIIPNSVTSIGEYAFEECTSLTSVHISNLTAWCKISLGGNTSNPLYYAHHLYLNDEEVLDLVIPEGVTSIGNFAFCGCFGLTSVTIPNSVTSIGAEAFEKCSGLISVSLGNGLIIIGDYAFAGCSSLTSVTIPNSVTSIGWFAFWLCSNLTSVIVGNGVRTVDGAVFIGCTSLTSVHIFDLSAWCKISFEQNSSNPLYYAHHLYLNDEEVLDLVIPEGATSIGDFAFEGCTNLASVTIPNSVTSIGDYAFDGCTGLTSIDVPNSVTSIGDFSFEDCSGLASVIIGNSVTSIGTSAFESCTSLTSVTIPNSVTSIVSSSFENCSSLTSVTIGNGVQFIYSEAFAGCGKLNTFKIFATSLPTNYNLFEGSNIENATLMVPVESIDAYKSTEPWSNFGTIIGITGTVVEKCATPTIHYADGKLTFECETEGTIFHSTITPPSTESYSGNEVRPSTTYTVSVYATKEGYEDSDVATAEINVAQGSSAKKGDMDNDGEVNLTDVLIIVDKYILHKE